METRCERGGWDHTLILHDTWTGHEGKQNKTWIHTPRSSSSFCRLRPQPKRREADRRVPSLPSLIVLRTRREIETKTHKSVWSYVSFTCPQLYGLRVRAGEGKRILSRMPHIKKNKNKKQPSPTLLVLSVFNSQGRPRP